MMNRKNLEEAIERITRWKLSGQQQTALANAIWNAIETQKDTEDLKARAVIEYLVESRTIELTDGFELQDLIG